MATTSLVYGAELDLKIFGNDDIVGATFTITDSDGNAVDFTGQTALTFTVYEERDGTAIKELTDGAGVSVSSNVITLAVDYSVDFSALSIAKSYYYELAWENASAQPQTISYGNISVI